MREYVNNLINKLLESWIVKKFNGLNIADKINVTVCSIIVITFIILFPTTLSKFYTISLESSENYIKEVSKHNSRLVLEKLIQVESTGNFLITQIASNSRTIDRQNVIGLLKDALKSQPNIYSIGMVFEPNMFDGQDDKYYNKEGSNHLGQFMPYIFRNGNSFKVSLAIDGLSAGKKRFWYNVPKETKKIYLAEPAYYHIAGKSVLMTAICIPILDLKGEFRGVLVLDIELSYIQQLIEKNRPLGGYLSILTEKGTIIAHGAQPSLITKNVLDLDEENKFFTEKIAKGEEIVIYHKSSETGEANSLKVFIPIILENGNIHWSLSSIVPKANILSEFYSILRIILLVSVLSFLIIYSSVVVLTRYITKNLITASVHLRTIAMGNFNEAIPQKYFSLGDEVGTIFKSMNTMQNTTRDLVLQVLESVKIVASSSEKMNIAIHELNSQTDDISHSMNQLTMDMEATYSSTQKINDASNKVEELIQNISKRSLHGSVAAGKMNKRVLKISHSAKEAQDTTNQIYSTTKEKLVQSLEESKAVEKISKLSNVILQIISQTNLLSLNAAIEAERAGDAGKGFSVVAEEIRKLSQDSRNTIQEIQKVTKTVISSVKNLSNSSLKVIEFIDSKVIPDYKNLINIGEQYTKDIIFIDDLITEISTSGEQLMSSFEKILSYVNEVFSVMQAVTNETFRIKAKTNSITLKINDVQKMIDDNDDSVQELQEIVKKFQF
ncbi:MAG: methyl-accepting chemotaxis protein [Leptospiraceae bacterium]|nr:methyl-accepting chemotaxis protein [Leptospiraceae bacterium]MCP5497740.1 methyl-accepting chemotaxis protein [Leptospiraceae bacterium]